MTRKNSLWDGLSQSMLLKAGNDQNLSISITSKWCRYENPWSMRMNIYVWFQDFWLTIAVVRTQDSKQKQHLKTDVCNTPSSLPVSSCLLKRTIQNRKNTHMRVRYRNALHASELIYRGCVGPVWCIPITAALFGFKTAVGFNALGILTADHAAPTKWPAEPRTSSVAFPAECPRLHI